MSDSLGPSDIQSVMNKIGSAKYITTFDGKSSYWTIPVKKEHQWLTAFTIGDNVYEWVRTPYGLKNSGSSFVRMLNTVLRPIKEFACSYVDDMAVFSNDWYSHLKHIDMTLKRLKDAGLTLTIKNLNFVNQR